MRRKTTAAVLFSAAILGGSAAAQTPQASAARAVIAATKVVTRADAASDFRAVRVTMPPNAMSSMSAADGILYQVSGSTTVSVGGKAKILSAGEGLFVAGGTAAALKAGADEPSTLLHFLVVPHADPNRPLETAPATATELYRTAAPIPDHKPGMHDLNLTRVTFPAHTPSNEPHYRSGAALYYVIAGTGANTIEGKTETRGPGSLIYEPFGLVHQWANPGDEPLTFLIFNISPEGTAAVLPGTPVK